MYNALKKISIDIYFYKIYFVHSSYIFATCNNKKNKTVPLKTVIWIFKVALHLRD